MPPETLGDWRPALPPLTLELWFLVIQHTKFTPTLLALALCCSAFRGEAQRKLFHYPRILESDAAQQHRFIHTIATSTTRLGPLVRIYEHKHGRERPGIPGGTHREVRAALRAMCNLEQLSLAKARTLSLRVLDGCRFKLEVFEYGRPRREDLDVLMHFLAIQPRLRHLTLDGPLPVRRQAVQISGLCPRLEYIGAYQDDVETFFRDGRPIRGLGLESVTSCHKLTACQSGQLEYLRIKTTSEPQGCTLFTPAHLRSLVILELVVVDVDQSEKQILEHLALIADLPRLPALILSTPNQPDFLRYSMTVLSHLFAQHPELEQIDVKHPHYSEIVYTRFLPPKDGGKPTYHSVGVKDVYRGYKLGAFD